MTSPESAENVSSSTVEAEAPAAIREALPVAVDATRPAESGSLPSASVSDEAWPEVPADAFPAGGEAEAASETSDFAGVWQNDGQTAAGPTEREDEDGLQAVEPILEAAPEGSRLEAILESLLFAAEKPLGLAELKRLLGERDGKKISAALQALTDRRKGSGIEVIAFSSGWHLRTNPEHATWVARLLAGKPVRLTRAMLETLAIVAYRQPITRPEIDDIRGVDCGPVLRTLLDRGLLRIIGKKEEVGRPLLYGTTPEFLRIFNLRDLAELPPLREFYELTAEDRSHVEAEHGPEPDTAAPGPEVGLGSIARATLAPEDEDTDPLLEELDRASRQAKQALGDLGPPGDEAAQPEETDPDDAAKPDPGPGSAE